MINRESIKKAVASIDIEKTIRPLLEDAYILGYDAGYDACSSDEQANESYKLGYKDAYDTLRSVLCSTGVDSNVLKAFDKTYKEEYGEM